MMHTVLLALLASAALVILLDLVRRALHRLHQQLDAWHGPDIESTSRGVLSAPRAAVMLHLLARLLATLVVSALLYVYLVLMLRLLPWASPYAHTLENDLMSRLRALGHAFVLRLPNALLVVLVIAVAYVLVKSTRFVFSALAKQTVRVSGFYPDWAEPTYRIIRALIVALTAVVVFHYLPGSNSPAFEGVSLFLGFLLSLGSAGAISHVVAGAALTYTRAFQVGDRVQIGESEGDVTEKTLLVTRIRTIKNVDISIPNASVLGRQIVNLSSSAQDRGLILHTAVTIGYDVPWRKVHQLLIEAAQQTKHVLSDPKPFVYQKALDDFYARYELNAYTDRPLVQAQTYSDLHQNIQDKLHEGGVEILSPHYTAIRDGHAAAVPPAYLPDDYQAPGFRIAPLRQ